MTETLGLLLFISFINPTNIAIYLPLIMIALGGMIVQNLIKPE